MSTNKLLWLGLAGVVTAAAFVFKSFRSTIPKDKVIQILEFLNRESYQLMYQISQMAREMINNKKLIPIQVKNIIEEENNPVSRVLQQLEKKAYNKFGVKEEDFTYAIERVYNKDAEVAYLQKLFSESYNKALLGVTPSIFVKSPIFLSEQKLLSLIKRVLEQQLRIMKQQIESIVNKVSLCQFKNKISEKVLDFKKQIITQQKLKELPDNPAYILQFAVKQYCSSDRFKKQYQKITEDYESKASKLFTKHIDKLTV